MRFKDSPVVELRVLDSLLTIEQDNHSMQVGTSVWPCSLVLVKFLERWSLAPHPHPYSPLLSFPGKRAVELGSGCGPAGMGLALLGLTNITLTDIAPVLPALRRNLKRNKPALGRSLKVAQLYWNSPVQIGALGPPFDYVIVADVVYVEETVGALVGAMESLVKEDGVILLGYQVRSVEADAVFWEMCGRVFEVEKVPHGDLHPEYAYEEADVYVMRKKKRDAQSAE